MITPPDATKAVQITLSTHLFIDHPSEPMIVIMEDGGWEMAFVGDTEWIVNNAAPDNQVFQIIPLRAIFDDLAAHIDRHNELYGS